MKFFCLSCFFLFAFTIAKAQQGLFIGDKVMIGHSWTVGNRTNDYLKYTFHPVVQFGRSASYNLSNSAAIELGTFFSTEGVTYKVENGSDARKVEQRMNYIRIPLGAKFTFGDPANKVRPRLGLGGSVGFLVGGKTFGIDKNDIFSGAKTIKAMSTKIDAGATASLGFSIKLTDGIYINHDINYYHGLVENKYDASNASFTHRNIGLSMGFSIGGDAMKKMKGKGKCKKM